MDDLLVYSVEQVAFEGNKGCSLSRLWEIIEEFYNIQFDSCIYSIDEDFKNYFWGFFVLLPEIVLNEVDEKSTSSNIILKNIKTKEVDLKLLKKRYNDTLRISLILEKQFLVLTGKEFDEGNKYVVRYFDLLSIICKHKGKGINQIDLAKQLNIDSRSLPSRINPLIEKGLVIRLPIIISKAQTFLLMHSRYANDSLKRNLNNSQDSEDIDNIVDINYLRICITNLLSKAENSVMRYVDLKRLCKINNKLFRRGFSKQIRSMEQLGFLERCRVANNKGYSKCVKLIKPYNIDAAKEESDVNIDSNDESNSSTDNDDNKDEISFDLVKPAITISRDLTIEFLLFQEIKNCGKNGISGPDLKKRIVGDQWSRPLQLILDKLSLVPEKSSNLNDIQPDHLSYFTIYREQEFVGRVNQYRYLSSLSYQSFCLENNIINRTKQTDLNVIFPIYDEFKFYSYDENPNIFNRNVKNKLVKLEKTKKCSDDINEDFEERKSFRDSHIENDISQNSLHVDSIEKETKDKLVDSDSTDSKLRSKRANSEEKIQETFPHKRSKKTSIKHSTTTVTDSSSILNTSNTLDDPEMSFFSSITKDHSSQTSSQISTYLHETSIDPLKKLTFQEHIDKNDFNGNLNYGIDKIDTSVSKKNSILELSNESISNNNTTDKKAELPFPKYDSRISLAYVRRQNLILEILHKNGGILQGGKYLNDQYNLAFKNKTYSSLDYEIDRKTMEKTLDSLKRAGKIHHICVAYTNAKGTKNMFWIVADTKYDIDGLEINDFKDKILKERLMKTQTYKPLPLKIENLVVDFPTKLKRKSLSFTNNSKFVESSHNQYKDASEDHILQEHELISQSDSTINNRSLSSIVSETKTSFVPTFIDDNKLVLQKPDTKTKTKSKPAKKLQLGKKLLNYNTADVFPFIGRHRFLNKNNLDDGVNEIGDYQRICKSASIRRKNNFTLNDDDVLVRAIFLSKWAYGGNTGLIDWELIKKILPRYSEAEIKSRFSTLRSKNYIKEIGNFFASFWESHYQNAIENEILSPISPVSNYSDILTLVEYSKTLDILENYDDIELPDTIEEITANYIIKNVNNTDDIRHNFFDSSLSLNAREIILYETAFSYSDTDNFFQNQDEIKSIIKSILITPEENYDSEVAKKLLESYEEDHIESVLQELIQEKLIVRSKSELNRILPGRNYRFSDKFLLTFKTCFPDFLFSQAVEFYTQITQEFQKNNSVTLSEFINSGSMACILDLAAHNYITFSMENVLDVFSNNIHQYNTQDWEDYIIDFSVVVQLKDISYTSLDKSIKYESPLKNFVWVDISGNILKTVYDQYLQTILSLIIQRPGINLSELACILHPAVDIQEIKFIVSSLIPNIVNNNFGALYVKQLYYKCMNNN
ncbi:hypothetical protein T552_00866 [Pneumocystis carinii B80]|uniref:Uncharacterized protein n=1 Tax=Pneumocystis carinii (strain B80) TaxID=1408658 RepID=A0A0W4ZMP4_PNEC8|nr:hypothetical protein T552_00866 [Pneumocystis carinii B80]KTW29657.1 hypothetical protein T552_00866 [Pneumocystis carinii B80]